MTRQSKTISELIRWTPPVQEWLIEQLLAPQTRMLLYGQGETWKSWMTLHLAYSLANGIPFLGLKTYPCSVLILQCEVPQPQLRKRGIAYVSGNKISSEQVYLWTDMYIKVDRPVGYADLEREIVEIKPKVLIIDNFFSTFSGRLTDDFDVRGYFDRMNLLIKTYGITVIVIHHMRKPQQYEGIQLTQNSYDVFGSVWFKNWPDAMVQIDKVSDTAGKVELKINFEKLRHGEDVIAPVELSINRKTLEITTKPKLIEPIIGVT